MNYMHYIALHYLLQQNKDLLEFIIITHLNKFKLGK